MLALWLVTALAFWALAALLPGIAVPSFDGALVTTGLIAILNRLLWPLLTRLFLPITVLTLGLGSLVGNALIIMLAINSVDGIESTFGGALAVAFGLAIVTMIAIPVLGIDGDAHHLRVVAPAPAPRARAQHDRRARGDPVRDRRVGRARAAPALDEGHAPTIARWLADGSHGSSRLGVRPVLADRREPGGTAARQQLRHAGLPLVREGARRARSSPTTRRTPPRSSAGDPTGGGLLAAAARAAGTCSRATRRAARRR